MREYRANVIVGCSISHDHYFYPYLLPFVTSFSLLSLGNGSALGTRGRSTMFLSRDTGCLPGWPRESTVGPSSITCCSSNFKLLWKHGKSYMFLLAQAPGFPPWGSLSILDVNCQHLKWGLGNLPHGMPLVSGSTQYSFGGFGATCKESKEPAPNQAASPHPSQEES